jgi:uncharacterized lipoprotein YddW (UPF0748 family)
MGFGPSRSHTASLRILGAALGMLAYASPLGHARASGGSDEVRALWVLRTSLESPEGIRRMVASASANGFNTLFVQVRGRGDAFFNRGVEARASSLAAQPDSFDPLADTLEHARDAGLRVHAWVNVNLISSATELPASREHVIYQHPEWLMVPRELAPELSAIDVRSPEYLGRLARWTRAKADDVEGLYVSPLHREAAEHFDKVVADLVTRYAVDGVHLDYVRYPAPQFDYSRTAMDVFRAYIREQLPPGDRTRVDALQTLDPYAWPEAYAEDWRRFRQSQLTALVTRVHSTVTRIRPAAVISAAVLPDARRALRDTFQDWRTWLDNGFIDALCPMAYTTDPGEFAEQIAEVRALANGRPVWAGIGAYRLSARETIDNITAARRLGADGIILFSYDSLVGPPNGMEYLATIGKAVFSASP